MITQSQRRKVLKRIEQAEFSISILRNKSKGRLDADRLQDNADHCKMVIDLISDIQDLFNAALNLTLKATCPVCKHRGTNEAAIQHRAGCSRAL